MKLSYTYQLFFLFSILSVSFCDLQDLNPKNSAFQIGSRYTFEMGEQYSSYRRDELYPELYRTKNFSYEFKTGLKYDSKLYLAFHEFRCRDAGTYPSVTITVGPSNEEVIWKCNDTLSTASLKDAESFFVDLTGDWGRNARLFIDVTSYYETNEKCPDLFPFDCLSVPDRCKDPDSEIRKRQCIYGLYSPICDKHRNCPDTSYDEDEKYCDDGYCKSDYDYDFDSISYIWYIVGPAIAISIALMVVFIWRFWRQRKLHKHLQGTTFVVAQPVQPVQVQTLN